jgi:SnoaL-like domain
MTESSYHNDVIDITQVLGRYALCMSKGDYAGAASVFAPDGTYHAFGETRTVEELPDYLDGAPHGLIVATPPTVEIDGDEATGEQILYWVDQATHAARLGYWSDTYRRTPEGWRVSSRSLTFLRRSGEFNSGKHVPKTPA